MPFKKGQSGNPGGRPKGFGDIRELARRHTVAAVETLVKALDAKSESARVAAAIALLDRGWGKPQQHVEAQTAVTYVARLPAPSATADDWQREHAPTAQQTR